MHRCWLARITSRRPVVTLLPSGTHGAARTRRQGQKSKGSHSRKRKMSREQSRAA